MDGNGSPFLTTATLQYGSESPLLSQPLRFLPSSISTLAKKPQESVAVGMVLREQSVCYENEKLEGDWTETRRQRQLKTVKSDSVYTGVQRSLWSNNVASQSRKKVETKAVFEALATTTTTTLELAGRVTGERKQKIRKA